MFEKREREDLQDFYMEADSMCGSFNIFYIMGELYRLISKWLRNVILPMIAVQTKMVGKE